MPGSGQVPGPSIRLDSRRAQRERALSLLYEAEAKGISVDVLLAELAVRPDKFVVDLVSGVGNRRLEIDKLIDESATGWSSDRMPVLDRFIAELATFELLARSDTSVAVIITEALELGKAYSTDDSVRFLNGLLSAIAAKART